MPELRPKDLFELMRARWEKPRERARDMRADEYGASLKLQVIEDIIAADPDPDALAPMLAAYVADRGPGNGPLRGVCTDLIYDWQQAQISPQWVEWLRTAPAEARGTKRRARDDEPPL
ncbi:MAG: hypothetical protein U0641_20190 [Anaerolineae bacterium]